MARRATVLAAGLPALAFTEAEIDALLLGLTMAATIEDEEVSEPALAARRRIAEALPPEPAYRPRRSDTPLERTLCAAMAAEQRLRLRYTDGKGVATDRVVWPVALTGDGMLAAWCEARDDFRHFRLDRIATAETTGERYPSRRRVLEAAWLHQVMERDGW